MPTRKTVNCSRKRLATQQMPHAKDASRYGASRGTLHCLVHRFQTTQDVFKGISWFLRGIQ